MIYTLFLPLKGHETVTLDLLTHKDIQKISKDKISKQNPDKVYLVLTYAVAFDR